MAYFRFRAKKRRMALSEILSVIVPWHMKLLFIFPTFTILFIIHVIAACAIYCMREKFC